MLLKISPQSPDKTMTNLTPDVKAKVCVSTNELMQKHQFIKSRYRGNKKLYYAFTNFQTWYRLRRD